MIDLTEKKMRDNGHEKKMWVGRFDVGYRALRNKYVRGWEFASKDF
jgi:hypothetical protein